MIYKTIPVSDFWQAPMLDTSKAKDACLPFPCNTKINDAFRKLNHTKPQK